MTVAKKKFRTSYKLNIIHIRIIKSYEQYIFETFSSNQQHWIQRNRAVSKNRNNFHYFLWGYEQLLLQRFPPEALQNGSYCTVLMSYFFINCPRAYLKNYFFGASNGAPT